MISFVVPGRAQPAGSKRAFVRGGKPIIVDANPSSGAWKERVAIAASVARGTAPPIAGPVELRVIVTMLRPRSDFKASGGLVKGARSYPITRPDLLKLTRAIEDAMSGIIYVDDSQIVVEHLSKVYGDRDQVEIRVRHMMREAPLLQETGPAADEDAAGP